MQEFLIFGIYKIEFQEEMTESLVQRIRNHDQQAMGALYQWSVGRLTSVCRRYVPDEDDAKDVLQNAFVRIFTALPTFEYRDEPTLLAWMRRIVVNEALRHLRDGRRLQFSALDDEVGNTLADEEPDVEQVTADELHRLVTELPDGYRTVVNLFVFEGMSHRQIAQLLDIGESTSASQFYHAKQLLAKRIKELVKRKP
jgi:RNA polymerase sigma-70 factor (ECF subfamily)